MNNKKRMKWLARLMAFALTGTMILGGAAIAKPVTTYAAGSSVIDGTTNKGTLTIQVKDGETALTGAQYTIYKVMSLAKDTSTGMMKYTKESAFNNALTGVDADKLGNYSTAQLENVITKLKQAVDGSSITGINGTENAGNVVFSNLDLGYYLVVETTAPTGYVAGSPFLVAIPSTDNYNEGDSAQGTEWVYDVNVTPKHAKVSIDKKLADKGSGTDIEQDGSVKVGDYVKYEISTTIPNYADEYFGNTASPAVFEITDMMSAGLDIVNEASDSTYPITVSVGDTSVSAADDTYTLTTQNEDRTKANLSVSFKEDYIKAHKGNAVKVTYYAKVTEKAVTGTAGNTNKAELTYNNKPQVTTQVSTPDVKVYSFRLKIEKFAGTSKLQGAEFEIYKDEIKSENKVGNNYTTDADGTIQTAPLDEGTYYLKETKAPNGYTLLTNPIKVEIIATEDTNNIASDGTFSLKVNGTEITGNSTAQFQTRKDDTSGTAIIAVENYKGFTLPSTGGAGIVVFLIVGAAGIVLVTLAYTRKSRKVR